jgi:hypothetical protein
MKGQSEMDEVKGILESKTFWSATLAILAGVLGIFHYSFSATDQASLVDMIAGLAASLGGVGAIIGRVMASKKIA